MIGIAITTFNRPQFFYDTLRRVLELSPPEAPVVVVDDGSTDPVKVPERVTLYRFAENCGIATAKNKCLELLSETRATHFFLFDDDTWPTAPNWWRPYVASDQPHLMYHFAQGPSHWDSFFCGGGPGHRAFERPRGCMLYVERRVLDAVGGMHTAFGKHGGEHGDWSMRIHRAGFTHQPFTDVSEPDIYCRDQREPGISSVDYRDHQRWRTVDASRLPMFADWRRPIPVLVPRRADHGHRDVLWQHIRQRYWSGLDGFELVEGIHEGGPFNRSAALNGAARTAGDWELAVIADSDSWVDPLQLRDAMGLARRTGRLVAAFDEVHELGPHSTHALIAQGTLDLHSSVQVDRVRTGVEDPTTVQSTMLVVPRAVWDAVGGFDEGFQGWGCEDNAFWRAATLLTGAPLRIPGPAWHLWHPPAKPVTHRDVGYQRNLWRWRLYANALCADDVRRLRKPAC